MQHSSRPVSRFLAIPLLAGITVLGVAGSQPAPPDPVDPELREIIDRALERATWAEEEGFESRYRRARTQRVQRFDGDGEVTDDETLLYQVEPYQGVLFSRLMARDGEPLDARGRREQERRWEEFQAEIDDPGEPGGARAGSGRRARRPLYGQAGSWRTSSSSCWWDLPAAADVPVVASAPERTWLWSDLHLSDPSVLLSWSRPFGSVKEMNRHLLGNWRRRVGAGDTVICLGDVAHPDAWRDDRLVLDLAECPGERLLVPRQPRPRRPGAASSWLLPAGPRSAPPIRRWC